MTSSLIGFTISDGKSRDLIGTSFSCSSSSLFSLVIDFVSEDLVFSSLESLINRLVDSSTFASTSCVFLSTFGCFCSGVSLFFEMRNFLLSIFEVLSSLLTFPTVFASFSSNFVIFEVFSSDFKGLFVSSFLEIFSVILELFSSIFDVFESFSTTLETFVIFNGFSIIFVSLFSSFFLIIFFSSTDDFEPKRCEVFGCDFLRVSEMKLREIKTSKIKFKKNIIQN